MQILKVPEGEYFFKVNNKDTRITPMKVFLVSLLLHLNKYLPTVTVL